MKALLFLLSLSSCLVTSDRVRLSRVSCWLLAASSTWRLLLGSFSASSSSLSSSSVSSFLISTCLEGSSWVSSSDLALTDVSAASGLIGIGIGMGIGMGMNIGRGSIRVGGGRRGKGRGGGGGRAGPLGGGVMTRGLTVLSLLCLSDLQTVRQSDKQSITVSSPLSLPAGHLQDVIRLHTQPERRNHENNSPASGETDLGLGGLRLADTERLTGLWSCVWSCSSL